jgi:hypothetical protein
VIALPLSCDAWRADLILSLSRVESLKLSWVVRMCNRVDLSLTIMADHDRDCFPSIFTLPSANVGRANMKRTRSSPVGHTDKDLPSVTV